MKANTILYFSWGEVVGKEKLILGAKNAPKHICITNVGHRKAINLHLTRENRKGKPNYLIELSYFQIGRLLVELQAKLRKYIIDNSIFQIIDTQKANSDNILFIPQEQNNSESLDFLEVEKRRFKLNDNIEHLILENFFISSSDFNDNNSKFFLVYKIANNKLVFLGGINRIENPNHPHLVRYLNKQNSDMLSDYFKKCFFEILLNQKFNHKETFLRYLRFIKYEQINF